MQQAIVVDTNILFSALLSSNSRFRELLLQSDERFFLCEFVLVEIFKRKEKIVRASQLTEDEIAEVYHLLLKRIELYKEDSIAPENRNSAYALCRDKELSRPPETGFFAKTRFLKSVRTITLLVGTKGWLAADFETDVADGLLVG